MVATSPQAQQRKVLLFQDEDGYFVAEVPSLPGCVSQGETRAEALVLNGGSTVSIDLSQTVGFA